jgi:CAAX protease family protein
MNLPQHQHTPAMTPSRVARLQRHPLLTYFVLAFALSWLVWIPLATASQGVLPVALPSQLYLLGAFGPFVAALLLTWRTSDASGRRRFFGQLLRWRVGVPWYLFVLLEPALATVLALGLSRLFQSQGIASTHTALAGSLPPGANPWAVLLPVFLVVLFTGGPLGEEPGWRGFALPRLQQRFSALVASVILGVLWGLWHLPLFFIQGTSQAATPAPVFLLGVLASTFLFTWVYNQTNGNLLLALLFHTALNTTPLVLPLSLFADWQGVLVQGVIALLFIISSTSVWLTAPARTFVHSTATP